MSRTLTRSWGTVTLSEEEYQARRAEARTVTSERVWSVLAAVLVAGVAWWGYTDHHASTVPVCQYDRADGETCAPHVIP